MKRIMLNEPKALAFREEMLRRGRESFVFAHMRSPSNYEIIWVAASDEDWLRSMITLGGYTHPIHGVCFLHPDDLAEFLAMYRTNYVNELWVRPL